MLAVGRQAIDVWVSTRDTNLIPSDVAVATPRLVEVFAILDGASLARQLEPKRDADQAVRHGADSKAFLSSSASAGS